MLWNRNYFLRFRFRFRLLKSYGAGSGSDFWKSYGSGSGSYLWKVAVPVPVPAPYLYHKNLIFLKKIVSFLHSKLFYKEKNQGCGSGSGSVLDPYSIGSVDPDPDP